MSQSERSKASVARTCFVGPRLFLVHTGRIRIFTSKMPEPRVLTAGRGAGRAERRSAPVSAAQGYPN